MAGKKLVVPETPRPRADCAVYGCGALTVARERTPTGWANFCEYHYVEYHHRRSEKRVRDELGLKTVEEMKAFCRARIGNVFKTRSDPVAYWQKVLKQAPKGSLAEKSSREFLEKRGHLKADVSREPGQDDEELAA